MKFKVTEQVISIGANLICGIIIVKLAVDKAKLKRKNKMQNMIIRSLSNVIEFQDEMINGKTEEAITESTEKTD